MPNWPDVWNDLGKELGVKLEDLEPTRLTIGGVGTAELLSRKFPIVWIQRKVLELGTLELHKQMFEQREFPWLTLDSAGAETTLGHLQGIVQKGASREEQSIALDVLAVFTAASLHEFEKNWEHRVWRDGTSTAREQMESWLSTRKGERYCWHRRSTTLGPEDAFLTWGDLRSITGRDHWPRQPTPLTTREFCLAVVAGHKRILDDYALVIPSFQEDLPTSIEEDFDTWLAERNAQRETARAERQDQEAEAKQDQDRKRRQLLAPAKRDQEFAPLSSRNTSTGCL
ncbi:hypothetical protein [Roseibium aggregatum]|uniref:hypothetical protein n=1 Tax=Roseibium aggregatum TaxID=187304 RepID=UPI0025ACA867|nr:hypothetical protein [Roseibium aggregatum]WJS05493.1 hypothetical protein QUB73_27115 [Roseibium aggregatum]